MKTSSDGNWLSNLGDTLRKQGEERHKQEVDAALAMQRGMSKAVVESRQLLNPELLDYYLDVKLKSLQTFRAQELTEAWVAFEKKLRRVLLGRMRRDEA